MRLSVCIVVLLLPLLIHASSYGNYKEDLSRRIVNGKISTDGEYPSTVAILKGRDKFAFPICGGTVVAPKAVLTAKHCLTKCRMSEISDKYYINSGSIHLKKGSNREVIDVKCYDEEHDVALLFVAEKFDVPAIEVPSYDPGYKFSECHVVGWGSQTATPTRKVQVSCTKNCVQRWTTLQVVNKEACRKRLKELGVDKDYLEDGSQFCGLGNRTDSCQGDSGGPLYCNNSFIGLVAWGIGCAEPDTPNVNMYVPFFKQWVEKNTQVVT